MNESDRDDFNFPETAYAVKFENNQRTDSMPRGGIRVGAGRPTGSANVRTREIANRASEEGQTPLEYLLRVMRDEKASTEDRMRAAEKAAPYVHPRLQAVAPSVPEEGQLSVIFETIYERAGDDR